MFRWSLGLLVLLSAGGQGCLFTSRGYDWDSDFGVVGEFAVIQRELTLSVESQ